MNVSSSLLFITCAFFFLFLTQNIASTASTLSYRGNCNSLPAVCYQPTNEYNLLIGGRTFSGIAYYTDALTRNTGSCGFFPQRSNTFLIAMPTPFMFMSYLPNVCNPNCDPLCGSCVLITNTQTNRAVVATVVDTATTDRIAPVLSTDAFLALGGNLQNGSIPITMHITSC